VAIGHVVTRGYGTGTFDGEIRQVIARGFFDSAVSPILFDQLPNITVKANTGSYTYALEGYFTGETSFSVSGLATGITFNTTTGVLTVNSATASGTTSNIVVTAINGTGSTPGNGFSVRISTSTARPYRGFGPTLRRLY
jgi:hypothetical protein